VVEGRKDSAPDRRTEHAPLVIRVSDHRSRGSVVTDYVVLFPVDNEAAWETGTEADHQATFDTDAEFGKLLAARGGAVTGGAGLTHSSKARTMRRGTRSNTLVTEGPYAESVEQLSGFYIVTCDDYDALVAAAQVLLRAHPVVEIRPVEEL
jgi:hypothetical protein